ncbi:MAG: NAD-dependent deacetylase [Magnetococcales bacterium]|nr:NAD-dependent deacetylase [Magnetococcales bacterium]
MKQDKEKDYSERVQRAAELLANADGILITAGAGMGVDSGLPDFRSKNGFWRAYPAIQKMNLAFEEVADPKWFKQHPRLAWGFYGHRLNLVRRTTPHPGFVRLLAMAQRPPRGVFLLTSNMDGQFQSAGFDPQRIEECHGSMHFLQCTRPCCDMVWSADDIHLAISSETLQAIGPLPTCPRCGAMARPNILLFNDKCWVDNRTKQQGECLWQWLEEMMLDNARLVIIEIGAGTALPVIRHRSDFYAKVHHAPLIRINPHEHHVRKARHVSLPMGGLAALEAIWQVWYTMTQASD